MDQLRKDVSGRLIILIVRSVYIYALAYFVHGFWFAREALYSPPLVVLILANLALSCVVAMLGLFGILLFAKQPGRVLAKIFFLRKQTCGGGSEQ